MPIRASNITLTIGGVVLVAGPVLEIKELIASHLILGIPGSIIILVGFWQFLQEERRPHH